MFRWIRIGLAVLLLSATAAYAALPGPHRALTPLLFGLHKIAPNTYSDAPDKAPIHLALMSAARLQAAEFFGPLTTNPRHIFCTTTACAERFGLRTRGLNYGSHFNFISPRGLNVSIITHELVHSELHRTMGLRDIYNPKFPQWFDEGLASYISQDTRLSFVAKPNHIKNARNLKEWRKLNSAETWQQNYSAAWTLVKAVADTDGIGVLQDLVRRVENGEDFDVLWRTLETQP